MDPGVAVRAWPRRSVPRCPVLPFPWPAASLRALWGSWCSLDRPLISVHCSSVPLVTSCPPESLRYDVWEPSTASQHYKYSAK